MTRISLGPFKGDNNSGLASSAARDRPAEELNTNDNLLGHCRLDVVFEPEKPDVDIVFVDGLSDHKNLTWTHGENMWPRDHLQKDLPKARVLIFGYDPQPALTLGPKYADTFVDHGMTLITELAEERQLQQITERPLIFVAHSLGGLICKKALLVAQEASETHMKSIIDVTVGVMFIGTPHSATDLAAFSRILTNIMSVRETPNETDSESLNAVSKALFDLQEPFRMMLKDRKDQGMFAPRIFSFFESMDYAPIGRIVPRSSAILQPHPSGSLSANHVDMVKFATVTEPAYESVLSQLRTWLPNMNKQLPGNSVRRIYHNSTFQGVKNLIQGDILSSRDIYIGHSGMRLT